MGKPAGKTSAGKQLKTDEFNKRLSDEIKRKIFGLVSDLSDAREAARLLLVCRDWRRVAGDDAIWFPLSQRHALVDARGRDLQAQALNRARKREEREAREQAEEVRQMAYSIHPDERPKEEAAEVITIDDSEDEREDEPGVELQEGDVPLPPGLSEASWRDWFIRKRRDNLIGFSTKLVFLMKLLPKLREEGSRVLIFSQSRKMLNIIELLLKQEEYTFLRIDGSINKSDERQRRVNLFNSDPSYFCFLLTTLVGGIGLNLTGADRVVIVDPSWNPTHDNQARSSSFIIARIITCSFSSSSPSSSSSSS